MASFDYLNMTFTVRNTSRTAMIECLAEFNLISPLYKDNIYALVQEGDWLIVKYAKTTIRIGDEAFTSGERTFTDAYGDTYKLTLPITHDEFYALPTDLASAWVTAAHLSNEWYKAAILKAFGLTEATTSEPKSGSASSNESAPPLPETRTTGG